MRHHGFSSLECPFRPVTPNNTKRKTVSALRLKIGACVSDNIPPIGPQTNTIDRWINILRNNPAVTIVSVLVALVGAIAALINNMVSITQLVKGLAQSDAMQVSNGGPVYHMPRLNGRTLDGCLFTLKSEQLQNGDPESCNIPSQMKIASQFCQEARYHRAVNFRTNNTGAFQTSYKMSWVLSDGKMKHAWNEDDGGGFIFTDITCE